MRWDNYDTDFACNPFLQWVAEKQVQRKDGILASDSGYAYPGEAVDINISTIQTKLVQAAGRWCESYASDLLYVLAQLDPFSTAPINSVRTWCILAGFREDGVDGNAYVVSRLRGSSSGCLYLTQEYKYRKLYAIVIQDGLVDSSTSRGLGHLLWKREISLVDLTHAPISARDFKESTDQTIVRQTLSIPFVEAERIQYAMTHVPEPEAGCPNICHTVSFGNDMTMDIQLCGQESAPDDALPMAQAILYQNGIIVASSELGSGYFREWDVQYNGALYRVDVIIK